MTPVQPQSGPFVGFLMLISSIFNVAPAAGAENLGASYSLSQAAEGRGR